MEHKSRHHHIDKGDSLASRGVLLAHTPFLPYKDAFMKCFKDPYDTDKNPHGYISLCVAENKLILEELSNYLSKPDIAKIGFALNPNDSFCYSNFMGLAVLRQAAASFFNRKFIGRQDGEHLARPENIVVGSGCAGLLNVLFNLLADENDAVLIPAPYYAAFDNDMKAIAHCIPFAVSLRNRSTTPTILELEEAKKEAESRGLTVKILLLTNPNNPLGVIYDPSLIRTSIEWARTHRMHTIVDEIYALSVHSTNATFHSVLNIMQGELSDDVHMLWALSKDFGSSGIRLGFLYTANDILLKAIETISAFSSVSHPMQLITAHMLSDIDFVDNLLEVSRDKLRASYDIVTESLRTLNIPYTEASAGIFVYCDFSSLLPEDSFFGEAQFSAFLVDAARVVMTPGQSQHDSRPGFYRICYAAIPPEVLTVAMLRISSLATFIKAHGWKRLDCVRSFDDFLKIVHL